MRLFQILAAAVVAAFMAAGQAAGQGVSPTQMFGCNQSVQNAGAAGTIPLVAAGANGISRIYVCGFTVTSAVGATFQLFTYTGTSGACTTQGTAITPALTLPANSPPIVDHQPFYAGLPPVAAGNNLCAVVGGTGPAPFIVYYTQF